MYLYLSKGHKKALFLLYHFVYSSRLIFSVRKVANELRSDVQEFVLHSEARRFPFVRKLLLVIRVAKNVFVLHSDVRRIVVGRIVPYDSSNPVIDAK